MNILILNYEYPPLGGGAGVCSRYHAEGLAALGHDITILTTWFEGQKQIEDSENLKIIRVKSLRKSVHKSNPIEMLSWVRTARRYFTENLADNKYDVCLANFAIPGGLLSQFQLKRFNIPYVIISHGQDIPWFFPRQLFFYHLIFYCRIQNILKNSVKNIFLTNEMKLSADKLIAKRLHGKNIIINNGCDVEKFRPDYSKKSDAFKIIFVGRLRQQKDPMTFLKSIKMLAKSNIQFNATIIGDGPMRKSIEKYIVSNKMEKYISVSGWVSREQLLSEYQSSSLLLSTSSDEGMSVALLEALSSGLYVIATPASGNREMITENINGNIIEFKDYTAITGMVEKYYNDKFLKAYRVPDEFLEKFRDKFKWDNIVKEYDKLINSQNLLKNDV